MSRTYLGEATQHLHGAEILEREEHEHEEEMSRARIELIKTTMFAYIRQSDSSLDKKLTVSEIEKLSIEALQVLSNHDILRSLVLSELLTIEELNEIRQNASWGNNPVHCFNIALREEGTSPFQRAQNRTDTQAVFYRILGRARQISRNTHELAFAKFNCEIHAISYEKHGYCFPADEWIRRLAFQEGFTPKEFFYALHAFSSQFSDPPTKDINQFFYTLLMQKKN